MRNFEPSRDFVERVMTEVREYEAARSRTETPGMRLLESAPLRYALTAGGGLLALDQVFRLAYPLLFPAICR